MIIITDWDDINQVDFIWIRHEGYICNHFGVDLPSVSSPIAARQGLKIYRLEETQPAFAPGDHRCLPSQPECRPCLAHSDFHNRSVWL